MWWMKEKQAGKICSAGELEIESRLVWVARLRINDGIA
jgi:hypothetical protein